MRRIAVIVLIGLTGAPSVQAGAWLREDGRGFLAVASSLARSDTATVSETRLYGEYGATPRLTLGMDISNQPGRAGHALVFARLPLGNVSGQTRFAMELGLGGHHRQGKWSGMFKTSLAMGRGFTSGRGDGWLGIETAVEHRLGSSGPIYKLDAVIGLSSGARIRPMLKLETAYVPGRPVGWTLTPSLMIDARKGVIWVIGLERKSAAQNSTGLSLGMWRDF